MPEDDVHTPTIQPTDPRFRDVPFDSGDFTAEGGGSWTVEAGDVLQFRYAVLGKLMFVWLTLSGTQLVGGVDSLNVKIPNGRKAKVASVQPAVASSGDIVFRSYPSTRCHTEAGSDQLTFVNALEGWNTPVYLAGMFAFEIR